MPACLATPITYYVPHTRGLGVGVTVVWCPRCDTRKCGKCGTYQTSNTAVRCEQCGAPL